MDTILSEFLRSFGVGAGIPLAFFFAFRLRKGGFTSSFTKSGFTVQRIEINKQNLVFLILAIIGLYPIFL